MTTQEHQLLEKIISTFESWNEDLKQARDEYKISAATLNTAREAFIKRTESKLQQIRKILPPLIILATLVVVAAFVITGHCGRVGWGDYNISIVCPEKK